MEPCKKYKVERILAWNAELDQYLIEWTGYHITSSTWEPARNIREDAPKCIRNFHRKLQRGCRTTKAEADFIIWVPRELKRWKRIPTLEPIKMGGDFITVEVTDPEVGK
ncbi:hypothetical protein TWF481_002802 [Arthrobotrys musiformis]|uniref:Chromo domain-containing protein n=1 Tax=Arthrobotrys musiformis TaxID=47236 RepID=A0AAV9VR93_9PEZI